MKTIKPAALPRMCACPDGLAPGQATTTVRDRGYVVHWCAACGGYLFTEHLDAPDWWFESRKAQA